MSDLFNIPEYPSPRLVWMREHDVQVGRYVRDDGQGQPVWYAAIGDEESASDDESEIAYGDTEDEAIVNLAKVNGWRLWNEAGAGK